ncbi:oligopeptide/dipeptide ABC transporter ATP-binding protein [Nonomuraea sp. MTCD27]|uniref:oligopeptide/dipeptide ABC transporter ATP-binding protein n=1 Tax=Nonomuraea sp. MTCD27 TaxID=1676747 RepID=UPI0035C22ADA
MANAAELRKEQRHPYTRALLAAEPPADRRLAAIPSVQGSVPAHDAVTGRCGFADRCAHVADRCLAGTPELRGTGWSSACVRAGELPVAPPPVGVAAPVRASAEPVLDVRELRKTYPGATGPALAGVGLTVAPGEIVAVVGESGSGKTTLARCVTGLERPDSGTILLGGQDCSDYTRMARKDVRRARRTVQMIFQDPYSTLNPARTVRATLKEALEADGRPADVAALLELVGLDPALAGLRPANLSGGERQRVAIARAVAGEPRLLVCDEPVSALDVSVQAQVLTLLAWAAREAVDGPAVHHARPGRGAPARRPPLRPAGRRVRGERPGGAGAR